MKPIRGQLQPSCVFCQRIAADQYDGQWDGGHGLGALVVDFEPLNPVTPGHRLFIPANHVDHGTWHSSQYVGQVMAVAHRYGVERVGGAFNIITSSGAAATQTVAHLHVHLVPRVEGDGLTLPWTGQRRGAP